MNRRTVVSASALAVTSIVVVALPAAAASPDVVSSCPPGTYYTITSSSSVRIPFSGIPHFHNGPGPLTMTVTKAYTGTVSFTVSAGVETEVGAIFAKAKASLSGSLMKSGSTTATNAASLNVPAGKYGDLQYVSYGKKVAWKKEQDLPNCTTRVITGIYNFPSDSEGWYAQVMSS